MTKRPMGELEGSVMGVLWDHAGWMNPGEVAANLDGEPLAYTTVMTILVRLWRKGRLERERDGRAFVYRPLLSREEAVAARMGDMLTLAGDRPAALARFLEGLSPSDRTQLRRLLQRGQDR